MSPTAGSAYPQARILDALERALSSPAFAGSERMCRFLRFTVERTLAGRAAELKEYTIGVEVFDRDPKYDPRVDPIVRVEARRLRSKLKAYYEAEGSRESILIDLPKGAYAPVFRQRTSAGSQPPAAQTAVQTIAVLPFENAARDADSDYLADGLTQQVIHRLTRARGVRVLGWNSASRMRERSDLREVARELSASVLLTGTVRSGGGRLRIAAQLVDAGGAFLWSEFYDRPSSDLFAIEEELAGAIVDALQVQLGLECKPSVSAEANDLYFRGRYYWNKRTADGLQRSIEFLRRALDLDPSFALAWAGLADSYVLLADYVFADPQLSIECARKAAEQALRLSPSLGEAECSLALIRAVYDWQWEDAGTRFRRAIELSPSYATAFHWYSIDYLALRGRFQEAEVALSSAITLDPLSSIIREGAGYIHLLARRYDRALSEYERLASVDPAFHKVWAAKGRTYIQMGACAQAVEALERARASEGGGGASTLGALGQAYGLNGNSDRARELLRELERRAATSYVPASALAAIHMGLGDNAEALRCLKRGCDARHMAMAAIGVHPLYDPLRNEPGFSALVEQVGSMR